MGRLSRDKGAAWERETACRLTQATGVLCQRNLSEVRDGNSGDLLTGEVPLSVQCKVGGRPPIYRAVEEAEAVAGVTDHPVAIVKRNGSRHVPPVELAVLPLEDFYEMVGALVRLGIWR